MNILATLNSTPFKESKKENSLKLENRLFTAFKASSIPSKYITSNSAWYEPPNSYISMPNELSLPWS